MIGCPDTRARASSTKSNAAERDVLRTLIVEGLRPVALGLLFGVALAIAGGRVIAGLLFHVQPTDLPTFGITAIVLLVAALVATWIPARRALRVDPVAALRAE